MKTIEEIFRTALKPFFKDNWGAQTRLATEIGCKVSKINNIASGQNGCSEDDRRLIALKLGYADYEAFLDIGRSVLGLPKVRAERPAHPQVVELMGKARRVAESSPEKAQALGLLLDGLLKE